MLNLTLAGPDADTVLRIARRAAQFFPERATGDVALDIIATHLNGCPLRLTELELARDFDFVHDIAGIWRHLDRDTGKLGPIFNPRYAAEDKQSDVRLLPREQIGDYVIEQGGTETRGGRTRAFWAVRMAGATERLSYWNTKRAARAAVRRYQAADKRRAK